MYSCWRQSREERKGKVMHIHRELGATSKQWLNLLSAILLYLERSV